MECARVFSFDKKGKISMPGTSHLIISNDVLEFSIDANIYEEKVEFDLSIGTGFNSYGDGSSINIEMNHLTINDLKKILWEIEKVINKYVAMQNL